MSATGRRLKGLVRSFITVDGNDVLCLSLSGTALFYHIVRVNASFFLWIELKNAF